MTKDDILRRGRLGLQNEQVTAFTSSLEADRWIFDSDLMVDRAHVVMLARQQIIEEDDASKILLGLDQIRDNGIELLDSSYEDVHIAIEARLIELIGEDAGGRMHSGRSRNDEVASCIRIALRTDLLKLAGLINKLRAAFIDKAHEGVSLIIPGFTHLQHAQPTTLAHHFLAYACSLERSFERLTDAYRRVNLCPLGAAAFAATAFPLDRAYACELMGFDNLLENSMDAVSTRDFAIETISMCANLMTDISRFAEETILWSTSEFNLVELADEYTSTSSIMPQKKNPDVPELLRARTGTVHGELVSVLSICKGLPYSYNRDLQEVTPHLQKALMVTKNAVGITTKMLGTLELHADVMHDKSLSGFSMATELADTLVRITGLPFRTAHQIVGSAVRAGGLDFNRVEEACESVTGRNPEQLGIKRDALEQALDPISSIDQRSIVGGPAPTECLRSISERQRRLKTDEETLNDINDRLILARKRLDDASNALFVS
ncbi:argininosuccinate lyase [Methanosarcinales archaeon ex4572_44]|nr:MAG: argininosuccinate lyase [Methanosarcinales archaeon ex4572_44]